MRTQFGVLFILSLLAPSAAHAQQSYGFIARLGRDTVSVERITRTGNKVVGDLVERSPRLLHRHYEAELAPDGSVTLYTIDTHVINPDPGRPAAQHLQAHFAGTEIHVNATIGTDTTVRSSTIPASDALTMPWLMYGYGSYELTFGAALKRSGDSIPVGYYVPGGRGITHGFVRRLAGGSASLDFFGSPIVATLDAQGRMLSLSGAKTTIKVEVERLATAPDIDPIVTAFAATERATGPASALSVRDTVRATIGTASLLVDYGRPLTRGRTILGNVVPFGEVWRTGANAATQFTTSAAITLAGLELAPGTYTLWTLPTANGVQLIVNKQTRQWGTEYHADQDLGRAAMRSEPVSASPALTNPVEKFTISILPTGARAGTLSIDWDNFHWTAPIVIK